MRGMVEGGNDKKHENSWTIPTVVIRLIINKMQIIVVTVIRLAEG